MANSVSVWGYKLLSFTANDWTPMCPDNRNQHCPSRRPCFDSEGAAEEFFCFNLPEKHDIKMKPNPNQEESAIPGIPDRLLDGYDCDGPKPSDEKIQWLLAKAPPEVRARADELSRQQEAENAPCGCVCQKPGADVEWIDRADIGMTSDYWEVTRMVCATCHTPWIRAFIEYEAFPNSGRFYRAPTTYTALSGVTPEAALHMIETASLRIAGGSRFDGVARAISGPGKLMARP